MRVKAFNVRGDLFATIASFAAQTVIKLASSLILTRILAPSAYGTIAILMSIVFVLAMISDVGFATCIVRSPNGDQQSYLSTAWTIRVGRAALNTAIVFIFAPQLAALYHAPTLTVPFRVISLWFLIDGLESTAFPLAVRRRNARVLMYSETLGSVVSAAASVVCCFLLRNFWGMVYGTLLGRLTVVVISHRFYRELKPRLHWDRSAAKEIFEYARFVTPSSILTMFLNQYDKAVFLRMFTLDLLGSYSLAGNMSGPIESLITKASRMVLYPRCAHNFRTDRENFTKKYYVENTRLFIGILAIPAAIGGAAHLIISLLYDPRYIEAASVLQAFMVRAVLLALASPSEDMLVATGESKLILVGNVYRSLWMIGASYVGYRFFGFTGFAYGIALSALPPLIYYLWLQRRKGMLIAKYEFYKIAFSCAIAVFAYLLSSLVLVIFPGIRIKL